MRTFSLFLIAVLFLQSAAVAAVYHVDSIDTFRTRIDNAQPGDTVILKDGTYSLDRSVVIACAGQETLPITITAETVGGVELQGTHGITFNQDAKHIVLSGFVFTHKSGKTSISVGAHHIRINRCTFACTGAGPYLGAAGNDIEIDHNEFRDKNRVGNMISITGENGVVARRIWIHHNYFHDFPKSAERGEGNGLETIRFGLSHLSMSTGEGIVEYNLFVRCRGENELISNKSCGNIYRYNTFLDSKGTQLTLRHGNDCEVYGNYFSGTDGLRIFGDRHKIHGNFFENNTTGITLGNGGGEVADGAKLTSHDRPDDCVIRKNVLVNNEVHYYMGSRRNGLGAQRPTFAENTLVGGNVAVNIEGKIPGAVWKDNIVWNVKELGNMPEDFTKRIEPDTLSPENMGARILTPTEVGPVAK
jgi:poly(beta-D-mannuronate) lyase